jgi:TRAP-type C4-dicarboxylate transport system substrate-binding protein
LKEKDMNWSRNRHWAAATGAVVLAAACSGSASGVADKAGGETVVLRLATIDGDVNGNGLLHGPQAFVDRLAAVSGGRFQIEVTTGYGDGGPDAESSLVEAIASGALDGGWPSTRAFADAGIPGLEAIEAPMTITSYAAQRALVSGPVADTVVQQLDGSGVVGLGLAVGPLRRPFAAESPLLGPDDWQGARFRVYNSPVQADVVTAFGGEPVNLGFEWIDEIAAGTLRGAEFDIAQYASNGLTTEAGNITANVVLWPKVFVLGVSQERFDSLTDEQREWLRDAAGQATQASVDGAYDENALAAELCDRGARFAMASTEQIEALRAAVAPVIEGLAADAESAPLLAEIQALAAQHPDTDVPTVPASCRATEVAEVAGLGPIPNEVSSIPGGTYRVEISLADVEAAGESNGPGWTGTWTLEIEDGTYALYCQPLDQPGRDCGNAISDGPFEAGLLRGTGSTVYFVWDGELMSELTGCQLPVSAEPGYCGGGQTFQATWVLDGDVLSFSDPVGDLALERLLEPLHRID